LSKVYSSRLIWEGKDRRMSKSQRPVRLVLTQLLGQTRTRAVTGVNGISERKCSLAILPETLK